MKVSIVPARLGHACVMSKRADPRLMKLMGRDGRRHLADRWRASQWSRALMIDNRCLGIGGVIGSALGPGVEVWLVLADEARRHPRLLLTEGRRFVAELLARCGTLAAHLLEGDDQGRRFVAHLGFWISPEVQHWEGIWYRLARIGDS